MTGPSDTTPQARDNLAEPRADAHAAGAQARAGLNEFAQNVGEKVSDVKEGASEKASEVYATARDRAADLAEDSKRAGAEQVSGFAKAIHKAADELATSSPDVAERIHSVAGSVEGMSTALRDRSAGELLQDLTEFARRQPAAVFGLAAVAGFAMARFAKSSTPSHGSSHTRAASRAPGWTPSHGHDAPRPSTMAGATLGGAAAHRPGEAAPGSMPSAAPAHPSAAFQTASLPERGGHQATSVPTERQGAPL